MLLTSGSFDPCMDIFQNIIKNKTKTEKSILSAQYVNIQYFKEAS